MIDQFLHPALAAHSWSRPSGLVREALGVPPDAAPKVLAEVLARDERLAAALVVLGGGRDTFGPEEAVVRMGVAHARLIAAALIARIGPADPESDAVRPADLHALACGLAARAIAAHTCAPLGAEALSLGLLTGVPIDVFGSWGLGTEQIRAVEAARAFDFDSGATERPELARALRHAEILADALCLEPDAGPSTSRRIARGLEALCVLLGIGAAALERLIERAETDLGELLGSLRLARPKTGDLRALLAGVSCDGSGATELPAADVSPARPLRSLRILAVDDDATSLRLLERTLRRAGHDVLTAADGSSALRIALEKHPQAVIADWMMPEMNGLELCRAMRRSELGRSVFFLLLTGRDEEDRVVEAFDAGVDDYVTKPFNAKLLQARLKGGQRLVELQERVETNRRLMLRQVAEMGKLTRRLRSAADTDALTGLPNRRHAMARLESEWEQVRATGRALSVMMIDIDHFKQVNDRHGHDVGDLVLREVASILWTNVRQREEVSRLGGEEFLVICPGTTESGAAIAAERLRAAVEAREIQGLGFKGRVRVSVGVAQATIETTTVDLLIQSADRAVYAAKAAGRNCVAPASAQGGRNASS